MNRLQGVLTGLIVVSLVAMLSVAAAQAAEYGRCKAQKGGKYTSSSCTTLSTEPKTAKDEWFPAPTGSPTFNGAYTASSGKVTLATEGGTVTCKHSSGSGEVTELNLGVARLTLTSCELGKTECASGGDPFDPEGGEEVAGVITTKPLRTRLVGHGGPTGGSESKEPAEGEVWTEYIGLTGGAEGTQVEFHCGEHFLEVKGSVSAPTTKVAKMATSLSSTFARGQGEQSLQVFVYDGETFKLAGNPTLGMKAKSAFAEKIEIEPHTTEPCCPCEHPHPELECAPRE